MEEEAKCICGTNFSYAEKDFFTNKLMKMSPNITEAAVGEAIASLKGKRKQIVLVLFTPREEAMIG